MSIRWRLTLWFALLVCGILVFSGAIVYVWLQRQMFAEVDDHLRMHAAAVHGTLLADGAPEPLDFNLIHSRLPDINELVFPGIYIQLLDKDGNVVAKSDTLGDQELPPAPSLVEKGLTGAAEVGTVATNDGTNLRIMVSPLYLEDQTLLLEIAQSIEHVETTMALARWSLGVAVLGAVVLAAVSGWLLLRRALSPVQRITNAAQSIEASSDLTRRVGYSGPMDEVGRLATTFDHMIEHLDRSFQSQRHFLADASHELRGPLAVLKANLDLLGRRLSEEDRQQSLGSMKRELERMSRTANDLLFLLEVDSAEMTSQESVSLLRLVEEAVERGQQLSGKHTIAFGHRQGLYVMGDGYSLGRLLNNLVSNAIRYTPEGGSITLSIFGDGNFARLEVKDTGSGIPPEHLPHIFDRFYRVDKSRSRASGGSGLGLAIVKAIAEQHGGKVAATSELGKGSTFTVWLPLLT
jgi:two-component system OmpR family sensor kinase